MFYLCSWRFVFYLVAFTAGLGSLINVSLLVSWFSFNMNKRCPCTKSHLYNVLNINKRILDLLLRERAVDLLQ